MDSLLPGQHLAEPLPAAPIRIRVASPRDRDALLVLFAQLDEFHCAARPDHFRPFEGPARSDERLPALLSRPDATILVADGPDGLGGLAVIVVRPPSGFPGAVPRRVFEIDNLVVRADLRGRRIGRRLLSEAVAWARQRRATHIEAVAHDFNQDALRFYRAFGFAPSTHRMVLAA